MNQKKINLIESISVVLPSKNHEKLILENFYEFKQFLHDNFNEFEILIVSNGSSKENVNLLKNKISLDQSISIYETEIAGKGNAVKLGISKAKYLNVVLFDSDFSYDYKLILNFFEQKKPLSSFCYGNRNLTKNVIKNTKKSRLVAGSIFNILVKNYFGINSDDTQAGLKFIDKRYFKNAAQFISGNYMYDIELFLLAKKLNIYPTPIYVSEINTSANTNIKLFKDSLEMFLSMRKIKKYYFS